MYAPEPLHERGPVEPLPHGTPAAADAPDALLEQVLHPRPRQALLHPPHEQRLLPHERLLWGRGPRGPGADCRGPGGLNRRGQFQVRRPT